MKQRILLTIALFGMYSAVNAQQIPIYSQYMLNQYIINPAAGGTNDFYDIKASYRRQWSNIEGAPSTYYISGHGPIGKSITRHGLHKNYSATHHGVGGQVLRDEAGPTSRTSGNVSYAYNLFLTQGLRLSFGAAAGFVQYALDGNQIITPDGQRNYGSMNTIVPDASLGFWLYHERFYAGISMLQALESKVSFAELEGIGFTNDNKLNRHYFITGGYKIQVDHALAVIPSVMIRSVTGADISYDFNVKARYNNMVWGGISYRRNSAVAVLLGLTYKNKFDFGYSYEFGIGDVLNAQNVGQTHELLLGLRLEHKGKHISPSDFW